MSDQGSTYAVLQSVPMMVSPLYKLPKKILIASELKMVPDDITKLPAYPFAVERQVIAEVEAARKKAFEAEEAFKLQKDQYQQEKKIATKKIADSEIPILQPLVNHQHHQPATTTITTKEGQESHSEPTLTPALNENATMMEMGSPQKHFDYSKFEQGLAPADPWDIPEDDMVALQSIFGIPKSNYNQKRTFTQPYQPPQQHAIPYQKNEGVYWNLQTNNGNTSHNPNYQQPQPQPQHLRQLHHSVPAIPPKLFNNPPLPTLSTTSPIVSPPTLPPPSDYHKSSSITTNAIPTSTTSASTPPPLPPLPPSSQQQPALPHEGLINELGHMGFTRTQAIDALEKNNHDLIKATHFLLDQA